MDHAWSCQEFLLRESGTISTHVPTGLEDCVPMNKAKVLPTRIMADLLQKNSWLHDSYINEVMFAVPIYNCELLRMHLWQKKPICANCACCSILDGQKGQIT